MSTKNSELATIFHEMAVMLEVLKDNPYRAKAYYKAAKSIEKLESDICSLAASGELKKIPGVGKSIARHVDEWCREGTFDEYEKLKARFPAGIFEILNIPGLGPKKARVLYRELGISSIGELEYACMENRLVELKGFGVRTQEKILNHIEKIKVYSTMRRAPEAYRLAGEVEKLLRRYSDDVYLVGGLRRFQEVASDVDFLIHVGEPGSVLSHGHLEDFEDVRFVQEDRVLAKYEGFLVDIRISEKPVGVSQLFFFTGSKGHIEALRKIGSGLGITISSDGVFVDEHFVDITSEEEIYNLFGFSYIPPELRENLGEIEAARDRKLPELITDKDICGIFHIHTTYSDGSLTLDKVVQYAVEQGYQYVGISDHSQSAFYAGGLKEDDLKRQRDQIEVVRESYPQIDVYWGIESDILPDGSLDYSEEILGMFDFVIGSVHGSFRMSSEDMSARIVKALNNPYLTILGHPSGRLLLGREPYDVDMNRIIEVAAEKGKIIELNAHPYRLDLDWRWCRRAKELGVPVAINPDAHKAGDFNLHWGIMTARKGWLGREDVFNAKNREAMQRLMKAKPWMG